jgi:microcin C transport system permease protein
MNPITHRRLQQFKANKRGYYSFIIFVTLFFVTLFADFIANDRPLIVYYKGDIYFPVIKSYSEKTFGGTFDTATNYRDPFVKNLIEPNGWMLWAPIKFGSGTVNYNLPTPAPSAPTFENILGSDDQGRDIFTRLLYGFRVSLLFGLALTIGASLIGIFAGAIQGYFGGKIDLLLQRFIEIWSNLPVLYLLIILSSMIEPSFGWLLAIMLTFSWMTLTGVVRAEFFRTRTLDYVRAAEALGVPTYRIIWKHMLPNAMVATVTYLPFILNGSIATLTSLDFLGFGLPPGSASLGELITQAKNNIQAPWIGLTAFFSIAFLLSLLIFIGEAVRDAFDSRKISSI